MPRLFRTVRSPVVLLTMFIGALPSCVPRNCGIANSDISKQGDSEGLTAPGRLVVSDNGQATADGVALPITGIRIRRPEDIGDPELLDAINEFFSQDRNIRVHRDTADGSAVISYDQPIRYYDLVGPYWIRQFAMPRTVRRTVNELLVVTGAAEYDPTVRLPVELRRVLEDASQKAELALWETRSRRAATDLRLGIPLFTERHGFYSYATAADIRVRDKNVVNAKRIIAELEVELDRAADGSIAMLITAMQDGNRIVRRFAAQRAADYGNEAGVVDSLIGLLTDPDPYVRSSAQQTLDSYGRGRVEPVGAG